MNIILGADFYSAPATEVAPLLCGKLLCVRQPDGNIIRRRITETECYFGEEDSACHAHRGRTPRTETLYMSCGTAYVYLCYGIHSLFNIVTGAEGHPEAVLIRGVEGAGGPGLTTKVMGITRSHNTVSILSDEILWCEDDGFITDTNNIKASPRIGIMYADEADRNRLWRYTLI